MTEDWQGKAVKKLLDQSQPVQIEADAFTWFSIIGNLQLALRHPGNTGPSAEIVRNFAHQLIDGLGQIDPDIARLCERGFHSCYDVERKL